MKHLWRYGLWGAGLVAVLMLAAFWWRPDGRLHVTFLATAGDAVLVVAPTGETLLIDGGSDPALLALELGRRLPFWRRSLDAVVLTRFDAGRVTGQVAALARYRPTVALAPQPKACRGVCTRWQELLNGYEVNVLVARPGIRLALGAVRLAVLDAPTDQRQGLVLWLSYGATRLLLAPTLQPTQTSMLLTQALPATLAYLPWEREVAGSLLARWRPRTIVFADGDHTETPALRSYHERAVFGATLYHEQNDGTIELLSDGRRAWVTTTQ